MESEILNVSKTNVQVTVQDVVESVIKDTINRTESNSRLENMKNEVVDEKNMDETQEKHQSCYKTAMKAAVNDVLQGKMNESDACKTYNVSKVSLRDFISHVKKNMKKELTPNEVGDIGNTETFQSISTTGNNSELEKFKRRVIRAVARMLLHEKRNENEVWIGLKEQTGCDCKELWTRMHALTMKKVNCLLKVEDRVGLLPKAVRMSITDWLLFDLVLAHQEFDVIGMDEETKTDRKVLVDLFKLVEDHKIEFLAGEKLAEAWSNLTLQYNSDNRQCSPMLLQRRWYQLKLSTRLCFYNFWSKFRGVLRKLPLVQQYRPTQLQIEVAKRYKPLVVKPFMYWEELVQNRLIILPNEFEPREVLPCNNDPDVMCLEPAVETINLDDSDGELEYRIPIKKDNVPPITIKQEPIDQSDMTFEEHTPFENREDKKIYFAEAVLESAAIGLNEIDMAEEVNEYIDSEACEIGINTTDMSQNENENIVESDSNVQPLTIEENVNKSVEIVKEINLHNETDIKNEIPPTDNENNDAVELDTGIEMKTDMVLPQITSVFGGINVTNETLSTISLLSSKMNNDKAITEVKTDKIDSPIDISSDSSEVDEKTMKEEHGVDDLDDSLMTVDKKDGDLVETVDVKPDLNKINWFGELSNDISFADDGIQLVDDGIACHDDEEFMFKIDGVKDQIKHETEEESSVEDEEECKVDKKLLMLPVVNTIRIDDMGILPISLLRHVDSKSLLDIISFKSKVIVKETIVPIPVKIEEEIVTQEIEKDEEIVTQEIEKEEEIVTQKIKKVKLSSVLLQKPRSRIYNSIQLCKNPDFNTRLKRLTVGFFSSSRNRYLFKSCKPLTIDVSKSFESRLVNGTMYLNIDGASKLSQNIDLTDKSQNVSIIPSAAVVQSLLNNINEIPPVVNTNISNQVPSIERNKVINLPDISEIRRINQKLLTAQVTPLQFNNDDVQITNVSSENDNTNKKVTKKAGPACRTIPPLVVNLTENTNNVTNTTLKETQAQPTQRHLSQKVVPWNSREYKPVVPWNCHKATYYTDDTLLALDTLNKMLFFLTDEEPEVPFKKKKKKKGASTPSEPPVKKDIDDDVIVVNDSEVNNESKSNNEKVKKCKTKTVQNTFQSTKKKTDTCCWSRKKINQMVEKAEDPSKRSPQVAHLCPFPLCLCCCKEQYKVLYEQAKHVKHVATNSTPQNDVNADNSSSNNDVNADNSSPNNDVNADNRSPNNDVNTVNCTPNNDVNTDNCTPNNDVNSDVAEIIPIVQETVAEDDISICSEIVVNCESPIDNITSNTDLAVLTKDDECVIQPQVQCKTVVLHRNPVKRSKPPKENSNVFTPVKVYSKPEGAPLALKPIQRTYSITPTTNNVPKNIPITIPKNILNNVTVLPTSKLTTKFRPRILPKASTQKLIYLHSKRISELASDNPVFLGKHKILLTAARFPQNFRAFEAFQINVPKSLYKPKGMQLVLEPSGQLTYSHDPEVTLSEDVFLKLPHLLDAIQNYIDLSSIPVVTTQTPTNVQDEIINLSDDESDKDERNNENTSGLKVTAGQTANDSLVNYIKSEEIQLHLLEAVKKRLTEIETANLNVLQRQNITPAPVLNIPEIQIDAPQMESQNNDSTAETQTPTVSLNTSATSERLVLEISDKDMDTSNITASQSETVIEKVNDTVDTANVNEIISENPSDQITEEGKEKDQINDEGNENKPNENVPKTKNILSDLMAMSGIGLNDITPTATESEPEPVLQNTIPAYISPDGRTVLCPENITVQQNQLLNPTSVQELNNALPELTAITSLSELKYACSQNSAFFKLDFESGLLVPINVCMKKLTETKVKKNKKRITTLTTVPIAPKSVTIDLTDDDVQETPEVPDTSLPSTSLIEDQDIEVHNKRSLLKYPPRYNKLKPLKLFKSPYNLENKLKQIQKRITQAMSAQDLIRRKLKRKKELEILTEKELITSESNQTSSPNESENLSITDDCSSDDEPLSTISKKKKIAEESQPVVRINMSVEKSNLVLSVDTEKDGDDPASQSEVANDVVDQKDNSLDDEVDDIDLDENDIEMECLDDELLDKEDDCILGV